jgi:protein-L-isoaspartate(D-aspartate) O-methyltransferase
MEEPPSFPWENVWPEITDAKVRAAFAAVDRAQFIEPDLRRLAARDIPLSIGEGQTISQPFIVAMMAQALDLHPGEVVLEIGTGSGFETAILCELTARPDQPLGATVFAVERLTALAQRAATTLRRLGYRPHLRVGDGAAGWPEAAPFAAIVVSAAASHVPLPLWEQLAEQGRMILPMGSEEWDQELWLVRKRKGVMDIQRLGGVRFVPLISPLLDYPAMWAEVA